MFFSAGKGDIESLSAENSRAFATKMHGLEKSKEMSYLTKSVNYLNSTKNVQYKVAMHVQCERECQSLILLKEQQSEKTQMSVVQTAIIHPPPPSLQYEMGI